MADTNTNKEKDAYLLTIRDVFFAVKETKDTSTTDPVYSETVYRKTIAKKVEVKGNGKSTTMYASGVAIATVTQETQNEITLEHIGLPTILLDELSGVAAENGISFSDSDTGEATEFAFGFMAERSNGVMDAMWFPNSTISPATALSYSTSEEEFKEQSVSMAIVATGLRKARANGKHTLYTKYSNQRDTTVTVEDFMKQVVFDETTAAAVKPVTSTTPVTEPTEDSKTTTDPADTGSEG